MAEGSSDSGRRRRLSRSGDFDRVYKEGSSKGNRFLVVHSFPRGEEDVSVERSGTRTQGRVDSDPRLGISVGKRIGKAVTRNKVKRVIRESFWELAPDLPDSKRDFVIVARPGVEGLVDRDGAAGVRDSLAELLGTGGAGDQPEERLS